ncbi:pyruvate carboxylase [Bradyrhizobium jicamae]|uniref:pyruvate carboxylase n=1 Tax=Bradyrhizobium jicamae TaxID=280332 RepID=UPI001BAC8947|nr:pyruvate carboxylase [Bradyrhizobium jicamae]MBR0933684.1 pyruvate carboxylase [Bradyrhizobium jicamae]
MNSKTLNRPIRRLLVANRSEIAIRIFRAATELGIRTFAVYAKEDRLSLHRFKADEAYQIGKGKGALEAYLSIDEIIGIARDHQIDAIHPGYGFLSESPELAEACEREGIAFVGPSPQTMRTLGNKVAARNLAISCNVPVMPASDPLPDDAASIVAAADAIGYPVMIKASWGGGGRGMRPIESPDRLVDAVMSARREAKSAFGKDEVYLEKLVRRARHVEVQILGDKHGNQVHLFERDCSIQRRHQKLIERAPAPYLEPTTREALCQSALRIARATDYVGAGTVEFLMDAERGQFYFIEVNPRIQVEHTVTESVSGLDIVKAQIRIAGAGRIGDVAETGIPAQSEIRLSGHALQCRITTEDPQNNFIPDYGRITAYRGAMGFGIRIDGGTAYSGAVVTRFYDPLLEKVTAWAPTSDEVIDRMARALTEYRIRGVATNLPFLHNVITQPQFRANDYTTRFIDETPALFDFSERQDRATKLLKWIADVTVNGHPDTKGRARPATNALIPEPPGFDAAPVDGTRQIFERLGPKGFASWMKDQARVLVTDTTMRDAHQSLLATRVRTRDIVAVAPSYAEGLPQLLSMECWGGATFDVAMRFLSEDPWERLRLIREKVPNILTQMLLRGANGVGYANYPDNVVRYFVQRAAEAGMDIFRIFDCLNWVENMRVSIDAVLECGKLAEGAICYTGDILDPSRAKYSLKYYTALARELAATGVHVLGLKDMAGVLKPEAARVLIKAIKDATDLPIHFHTHDTSGIAGATILAAIEAGVDAIDASMDAMSGTTSQPALGSIVEALVRGARDTTLDPDAIRRISLYWQAVRAQYAAFESDMRAGASEVYLHEMPGGQFTNLKEQARSLGLEGRWHEVAKAYRAANDLFGDIVKVTPSSKVVGDMALMMVSQGLTPGDILDPAREIAFPASVVDMLRGDLGQPPGGWPKALQDKAVKGEATIDARPGSLLGTADLSSLRLEAAKASGRAVDDLEFAAYLMYPKVFAEFSAIQRKFGPVSVLPTLAFFYGMKVGEELMLEIEDGKSLIVVLTAIGDVRDEGQVELFFELNGQPRVIAVPDRSAVSAVKTRPKSEDGNVRHIAAPMPGVISTISVAGDQSVKAGDVLMTLEAMKMETVLHAPHDGVVAKIWVERGTQVDAKDLLIELR